MEMWKAVDEAESALKRYSGAITIAREVVEALTDAVRGTSGELELAELTGGLRQVMVEREHILGDATTNTRITLDYPEPEDVARFAAIFKHQA